MSKQKKGKQNTSNKQISNKNLNEEMIKKQFGEYVSKLMERSGVSWEVGKLVAMKVHNTKKAIEVCQELAKVKNKIKADPQWKSLFEKNKLYAVEKLFVWTCLHNRFNLQNPRNLNLLINYLFAD